MDDIMDRVKFYTEKIKLKHYLALAKCRILNPDAVSCIKLSP